jgi:hypothetical protein
MSFPASSIVDAVAKWSSPLSKLWQQTILSYLTLMKNILIYEGCLPPYSEKTSQTPESRMDI